MSDEDFVEVDRSNADFSPQHGPRGPVQPLWAWLEAIDAGDYETAWAWCDDNLRLARAQSWLFRELPGLNDDGREVLCDVLWAGDVDHPVWEPFAEAELALMQEAYGHLDDYGAASGTRLVGVDLEVVVLVKTDAPVVQATRPVPETVPHFKFLMRSTPAGWRLAAHGTKEPVPGWPPSF